MVRTHYENFPVASLFLPKGLRPAVAVIYAFARTADDIADEGERSAEERLEALDSWQCQLDACVERDADHPIFIALGDVLHRHAVHPQLLRDLLTAFRMDVRVHRYATFADVLHYCRHSANPVGRIVLHLFGAYDEALLRSSDAICTALQLTNFWQDVVLDADKGRIYIPLEDMARFGYTDRELFERLVNDQFRQLLAFEVERTRRLFFAGESLMNDAPSALRFELTLTWHGGMRILEKIERAAYDVVSRRPVLGAADKVSILLRSFLPHSMRTR
ncbi:MAG: squalene synthase HpnC [Ignavibacteria bacterium]